MKDILKDPQILMNKLPGNIFWIRRDGMYLGCNENHAKIHRLESPDQIIGRYNEDLLPPDICESLNKYNDQVFTTGKELVFEEEGLNEDLEISIYLTHKIPVRNEMGKMVGLIGISLDITEKKQLELSLIKAKKKAEEANKAKSEFIANVSHDLRTPLTGIVGLAEVIEKRSNEEQIRQFAKLIFNGAMQLSDMMNRILECCQFESPHAALAQDVIFNVNDVCTAIQSLVKPLLLSNNLAFNFSYDETIPPNLIGKSEYLYQIILNLVNNAIKFTEQGSVGIEVKCAHRFNHAITVEVRVTDTGIGIPKESQKVIFDVFARIAPTYAQKYKGLGLGLFLVRQLIDRMGAKIRVQSTVGEGSAFICSFPFKVATAEDIKKTQEQSTTQKTKTNDI